MKKSLPAYCYRKGRKGYIYFVRGEVCERMPDDPTGHEFAEKYARLRNNRFFAPANRTVKKLIADYLKSNRWAKLSPNTQRSYRRSFKYLEERVGRFDVSTFRRVHVLEMQEALSEKPTTANRRVGAFSVLFEHAIGKGWINHNPAKGIENLAGKRAPREPWPEDKVQAFRDTAPPRTLLLFEMLIGTGQRIGDVLRMEWSHMEDGGIWVTQQKTGVVRFIPFTARLSGILDATEREGDTIITREGGLPVSYQLAWKWVKAVRDEIGAEAWDVHSLRHSAASEIAAIPGMSFEHVRAITGHSSDEMARLYAGKSAQIARAKEAQERRK